MQNREVFHTFRKIKAICRSKLSVYLLNTSINKMFYQVLSDHTISVIYNNSNYYRVKKAISRNG